MKALDNYECKGQMTLADVFPNLWSGKTFLEPSAATKEKTSDASLKKQRGSSIKVPLYLCLKGENGLLQVASWETGGPLLGEYMMHSFGESPREERESRLSQILEVNPHPKYCLSARACQGILNRAERRGKELPPLLRETLLKQSVSKNVPDVRGGARESLYNTSEQEPCQHLTTNQSWDGSQTSPTLTANNAGGSQRMPDKDNFNAVITYGLDRASFNQGKNALYDFSVVEEQAQTLVAKGPGGVLSRQSEPYAPEITKE